MLWGPSAQRYAQYKAWANQRTFEDVSALSDDQVSQKRDGLFGSIAHTLNHNLVIDAIFQSHLQGRQHGYSARNTPTPPALTELIEAQREIDAWWLQWATGLTESASGEPLEFDFVDGGQGVMTRGEILIHVVNHNAYHRGFVAEMMYQIPVKPSATDFPVFVREFVQ